jgi:hypothetical protein
MVWQLSPLLYVWSCAYWSLTRQARYKTSWQATHVLRSLSVLTMRLDYGFDTTIPIEGETLESEWFTTIFGQYLLRLAIKVWILHAYIAHHVTHSILSSYIYMTEMLTVLFGGPACSLFLRRTRCIQSYCARWLLSSLGVGSAHGLKRGPLRRCNAAVVVPHAVF